MSELDFPISARFFIALAISVLIGLERESSSAEKKGFVLAGVRTYSLVGVYAFGCAWLYNSGVTWLLPVGLLSITAIAVVEYLAKLRKGHIGFTSETAVLLTFVVGAMCLLAEIWLPLALGIVATLVMSEKTKIEGFVSRLDQAEFLGVLKFLLVTVIILPVLPDENFTQFNLNPRTIWKIVVLVSSIGFAGYFLSRKLGQKYGLWLSGLLGGIASSTAVAIATGRTARKSPASGHRALQASILASGVMYLRIAVLIWIIRPEFVSHFWWKLVILAAIGLILAPTVRTSKGAAAVAGSIDDMQNPFEIRPAIVFALLYVVLTVVTAVVTQYYGDVGLLGLASISGVTDIDPFILSLARHTEAFHGLFFTAVGLSMMSNTIVKGIYFGSLAPVVRREAALYYGIWAALHIPILMI